MAAVTGRRPAGDGAMPGGGAGTASGSSPDAARLTPPRWRDRRLALGVVLVLVAVLLGARLLAGGGRTSPVLVAARPLTAGHTIATGDLRVAHVRLGETAGGYWPGTDADGLRGHPVLTTVGAGDLLARSAVGATASPTPTREVSLPVDPARMPPLQPGDLVDVYATSKATTGQRAVTAAVLRGVEYLGGGDTGGSGTVTARLQVPVAATGTLVRASETDGIDLVRQQPAGDDAGDVGGGAVPDPVQTAAVGAGGSATP